MEHRCGLAFRVSSPSKKVAWIDGTNGIDRTTNGGSRWTFDRPEVGAWFSITALDAKTAWAGMQREIDDVPGTIYQHTGSAAAYGSLGVPARRPLTGGGSEALVAGPPPATLLITAAVGARRAASRLHLRLDLLNIRTV